MNFFLLAAVPLAAVIFHRLFHTARPVFVDPRSWILGTVWSVLSLLAVAPFGKMREFTGSLLAVAGGLIWTDALLVPGVVLAAWILTRPKRDFWELGLWLVLAFTLAGIRDFAATTRISDLNEFFLVPFDRILLVLLLPLTVSLAFASRSTANKALWWTASLALILTGPLFQVLSFAGWSWTVGVAEASGLLAGLWWQKLVPVGRKE